MNQISKPLLDWYKKNARPMPWRVQGHLHPNPYHVWISEIMLQQTMVKTVIPYYEKFLKLFPTIQKLAQSDEKEVLHAWQGLGYYSRARNLHMASKQVLSLKDFPKTSDELKKIKGIGSYTAAAIASLCFGEKIPVVDGNVKRVFARLYCLTETQKDLEKKVFELSLLQMENVFAGDYNSAVMDLGATICSPNSPQCLSCPLRKICCAYQKGQVDAFPKIIKKAPLPIKYGLVRWNQNNGFLRIRKRETGILKGLYEIPWDETDEETFLKTKAKSIKHTFTHFHLFLKIIPSIQKEGQNVPLSNLSDYPFSNLMKKVLKTGL